MDARNVFSHPNLEQTIRPINIVVDGSDKPQVWEEERGWGTKGAARGGKQQQQQQQRGLVTLLRVTSKRSAIATKAGRRGGQRGAESN